MRGLSPQNVGDPPKATRTVYPASPAYPSLAYHRTRLLGATGRPDDARTEVDRLLQEQGTDLAPGDRNRLLSLRTRLATSVTEVFPPAPLVPVEPGPLVDNQGVPGLHRGAVRALVVT